MTTKQVRKVLIRTEGEGSKKPLKLPFPLNFPMKNLEGWEDTGIRIRGSWRSSKEILVY